MAIVNGNNNNNNLSGTSSNNILIGLGGNDTLNGGDGIDILIGGTDNDTYIVDSTTDVITELANEGTDTIQSSVTFSLEAIANVENLTLSGTAAINGTGNAGNNVITGNTANNNLNGGGGDDTLAGSIGNDTLNGDVGIDTADYSTLAQSITLLPTGIVNKAGGTGTDQLIKIEKIVANAAVTNNTIDASSVNADVSINANLGTQSLTVNGTPVPVGPFTVVNFDNVIGTNGDDTIIGDGQDNLLFGQGGNDTLNGGAGNDSLNGGDGNDTLNGSKYLLTNIGIIELNGNDTLVGGNGDDTYIVDSTTNIITENANQGTDTIESSVTFSLEAIANVENLTLSGTDAINATGNADNNVITGNTANNNLNGGGGDDTLTGSIGNDTLNGDVGIDTADYSTLAQSITLLPTGIVNKAGGTGTDQLIKIAKIVANAAVTNNTIDASSVNADVSINANLLTQSLTVNGTPVPVGPFTVVNFDNVIGTNGDDTIIGDGQNNLLFGQGGNDSLNGGAGIDTLIGGNGDDIYIIDSTADVITEFANQGTDTIESSVTFSLSGIANVENLTLTGTAAINGTGNAADNFITGNASNNTLNGGDGIDTLIGGNGDDIYIVDSTTDVITEFANEGKDTIESSVTFSLSGIANVENLTLTGTAAINGTGNAGNNVITGNANHNILIGGAGNDILIGGAGNDILIGGADNDIYIIDSTADMITEFANRGTDTIESSVTFSLDTLSNVENLTLTGTAAINGTGNADDNFITGNASNNTLNGGAGNDTLNGGAGNDILTGGIGKDSLTGGVGVDRFDYRNLADSLFSNFDVITDFNAAEDRFVVSTARAGSLFSAGSVATFNTTGIAAKLTSTTFRTNFAARFTFGTRTFVAINDDIAGFNPNTDAIIEVTGLSGTLGINNFTTALA
jgi:Ca2+-binding RTX toxin-like protein